MFRLELRPDLLYRFRLYVQPQQFAVPFGLPHRQQVFQIFLAFYSSLSHLSFVAFFLSYHLQHEVTPLRRPYQSRLRPALAVTTVIDEGAVFRQSLMQELRR